MTNLADWPFRGWIMPERGTFQWLPEREAGAIDAEFLHVVSFPEFEVVDVVAWDPRNPGIWWTLTDVVTVAGERELRAAWWEDRPGPVRLHPARLVATPAEHRADPDNSCVVLDWAGDISAAFGLAPAVQCASPALAQKLYRTLLRQALPKLEISAAEVRRAAA